MLYMFTIAHMEHVIPIYTQTPGTYNFILIMVVKASVSTSKFHVFDMGYSLHLKHKNCIDADTWVLYSGLVATLIQ